MVILKNADYADTTNYGYDADAHIVHIFRVKVSRVRVSRVSTRIRVRLVIIARRLNAHRIANRYPSTVVSASSDLSGLRY